MQFHFNLFHTDTATGHTACYPGYDMTAAAALLLYRLRGSSGARPGSLGHGTHTWKHFRASLHCNWTYYHNYSFKAPAICIRHAPAQPAGLWPRRTTPPPSFSCLHFFYTFTFVSSVLLLHSNLPRVHHH